MKCETCNDTGYYGDNGPGIHGNGEYAICDDCKQSHETGQVDAIVKRHYEVERKQYDHWDRVHYGSEDINNGRLMAYWENIEDAKEVYNHYLEFQPEYEFRIIEVQRIVTA